MIFSWLISTIQVVIDEALMSTLVMKFGGAAVASPEQFSKIADIIISRTKLFNKIVVVVSAMGDTTDELIELAKKVNPSPPRREYDMLVSVGERISMSLLAMALSYKKVDAISFTGSQSGIITCENHSDAKILDVRPYRIIPHLEQKRIVIVAGFQGVSKSGEITTLGRGGSDTTAVALGVALNARHIEFFKDVDGIYSHDPKQVKEAELLSKISYDMALEVVSKCPQVLQFRCIELAKKNNIPLHILSFHNFQEERMSGTVIGLEEQVKKTGVQFE